MTFNINDFKTRGLTLGGARPALFEVQFTPPISVDAASSQKFSFSCRGAQLPAAQIGAIDVGYFGRMIKLAGDRTFTDWSVTVMNDEDFLVRTMFEKWSNSINALVNNYRSATSREVYKCDMNVIQYAKTGFKIAEYSLVGAFPTTIDAIDLNWETQNQVETFGVTFSYDYWVPTYTNNTNNYQGDV